MTFFKKKVVKVVAEAWQPEAWQPISTAPRDGRVIEIKCTYGVKPWYGLVQWTDSQLAVTKDGTARITVEPTWVDVLDPRISTFAEWSLMWRPFLYKGPK